jgi:hypothetical protein
LALLRDLGSHLEEALSMHVQLVKRRTYQEVVAMLLAGQLDAAWICGFPYIRHIDRLALLSVPLHRGRPLYQSYLVADASLAAGSLDDLRGHSHAFSDPDSNSGFLVTRWLLANRNSRPETFFSHPFFTNGHRNVLRAVVAGLADSGSVDGYVWETVANREPALTDRTRDLLVRQRTQLINAIRAHLAEFGVIEAQGPWNVGRLVAGLEQDDIVPELVRDLVQLLAAQLEDVETRIAQVDTRILAQHKADPVSQRLASIPGVGPLVATAIAATVPDPSAFRSGREFAAWLGLVPRQNSTGGKTRLGRISRQGDAYIRRLLVIGAQSVLYCSKAARANPWIQGLLAKRPRMVVAVALANKTARIAWAVMARGTTYRIAATA